ncbi:MAG TPA: ATP synthase F1 subunit epsilon [Kiritimatiellia bacterium]|nr:ATP synthase F1 subunit epsilon [Kiritimatiellia bacterium]
MPTFHLTIVSANGKAYEDQVESLVLPGVNGDFGILANHTALIGALREGLAKITRDGQELFYMVGEGYVDVANNEVAVMVGNAAAVPNRETGKQLLAQEHPWAAAEALNNPEI